MSLEAGAGGRWRGMTAAGAGDFIFLWHYSGQSPDRLHRQRLRMDLRCGSCWGDRRIFNRCETGPIRPELVRPGNIRRTVASAGGQMSDVIKLVRTFAT